MTPLRDAYPADAEAIAAIYTQSILAHDSTMDTEPYDAPAIQAWLDAQTGREALLVLEAPEGDGLVGWGILKAYSDRPGYRVCAETSVYLDRRRPGRQGHGSRLQQALIDRARALGYHHLAAKIWADNAASLALHYKFGYTLVGIQREVGRVGGRWRDVAILQKLLDDGDR